MKHHANLHTQMDTIQEEGKGLHTTCAKSVS